MSHPAERSMPVTTATWSEIRRRWMVALPGGLTREERTEADVFEAVRRWAPGSSTRFIRTPPGT